MKLRKCFAAFMAILLGGSILAAAGCKISNDASGGNVTGEECGESLHTAYKDASDARGGGTLYFSKDGVSKYKIVVPETSNASIDYAADFLVKTFKNATGSTLAVENDANTAFDRNAYVISLGDTKILKSSPVAATAKDGLTKNGFVLSLQGNTVLIGGQNNLGVIYGTQELLAYALSFEVYTSTAIYYDRFETVAMPDFGTVKQSPDIPYIAPGPRPAEGNEYAALLRSYDRRGGWGSYDGPLWDSVLIAHSIESLIPRNQYPQWYNNGQICYSAEDSYNTIAEKVAGRIVSSTTEIYFQLGNADTTGCCDCEGCAALAAQNGGMGGAYIVWLNTIADLVEKKLAEEKIEKKEWYILGLMYKAYDEAPVVYDEASDKYLPVSENVICSPHVGVHYCPIDACFSHSFDDPDCVEGDNAQIKKKLYGWSELTDTYLIWQYSTEFTNYFYVWDDYGTIKRNSELFKELGVQGIYFNRGDNTMNPFDAFRTYLITKLSWDTTLSYETLYNEFFYGYYREAAPYMMEYFEAIRANMNAIDVKAGGSGCLLYGYKTTHYPDNWSFPLLQSYERIIDKAYSALKNAGYSSGEYEIMRLRVRAEEMFCTNYFLRNYQDNFSEEEYEALSDAYYQDNLLLGNVQRNEGVGI